MNKFTSLQEKYAQIRQSFHMEPELSLKEFETQAKILQIIATFSNSSLSSIKKIETGLLVDFSGCLYSSARPIIIAIRADTDALPITETTKLPYSSETEGVMHACGHDGHITIALMALEFLLTNIDHIPSNISIRFIFQPAEEIYAGAKLMIENGALDNVDFIFGLHNGQDYPLGTIAVIAGPSQSQVIYFKITVLGRGGHGFLPDKCRSPINTGSKIIKAISQLVATEIDGREKVVLSIGKFNAGTKSNVIPDMAEIEGTCRVFNEDIGKLLMKRITEISQGIAAVYESKAEIELKAGSVLINDGEAANFVKEAAEELFEVTDDNLPIFPSEDFAEYTKLTKACFFLLGGMEEGYKENAHTSTYNYNDNSTVIGAKMFTRIIEKVGNFKFESKEE